MTYAKEVRLHLTKSLAAKAPFDRAWDDAMAAHRTPSGWPIELMRKHFRAAYAGQGLGSLGILADRDEGAPVAFPSAPTVAEKPRRCGSSAGCISPVAPDRWMLVKSGPKRHKRVTVLVVEERPSYLCPTHQAEILAAIGRAEYRGRGEVEYDMSPAEAVAA